MAVCKRKKRCKRRRVRGGYMEPGMWVPQPSDKSYRTGMKEDFKKKNKKNEIGWTDAFNWYKLADKVANKNVIDEGTMYGIMSDYKSGDDSRKKNAIERMQDQLVIRDIMTNPEDYIREYEKGKHRKNNWAKWVGGAAEVAAILAGAYGAYKYGPSIMSKFTGWKASDAVKDATTKAVGEKVADSFASNLKQVDWGDTKSIDISKMNTYDESTIDPKKFSLFTAPAPKLLTGNDPSKAAGMRAYNGDKFTIALPDVGEIEVDMEGLQQAAKEYPDLFPHMNSIFNKIASLAKQYGIGFFRGLWNLIFGSGFRVTRKGRRLVNRYRRHLRIRRR